MTNFVGQIVSPASDPSRTDSDPRRHVACSMIRDMNDAAYSNEMFDRTQQLAIRLTDADRAAGRPAPTYGYSQENFDLAEAILWEEKMRIESIEDDDYISRGVSRGDF